MGLYAVKQRGGIAIVQDPNDAAWSEMPRNALAYATPHYVLKARDIVSNLVNLVQIDQDELLMPSRKPPKSNGRSRRGGRVRPAKKASAANGGTSRGGNVAGASENEQNLKAAYFDEGEGNPSVFACPECHGILWEIKEGDLVQFRCRVGHSYGTDSLAIELSEASEAALWAAMRALEEKAAMQRRIADSASGKSASRLRDQSAADDANAQIIRDMIFARDAALEQADDSELEKTA
jgi:two-component system chemotaxis response regulator CheB